MKDCIMIMPRFKSDLTDLPYGDLLCSIGSKLKRKKIDKDIKYDLHRISLGPMQLPFKVTNNYPEVSNIYEKNEFAVPPIRKDKEI